MAGNVREWVEDRYEPYPGSRAREDWFLPGVRIVRGGCYKRGEGGEEFVFVDCAAFMRVTRDAIAKHADLADVGFRCAKTIQQPEKKETP